MDVALFYVLFLLGDISSLHSQNLVFMQIPIGTVIFALSISNSFKLSGLFRSCLTECGEVLRVTNFHTQRKIIAPM